MNRKIAASLVALSTMAASTAAWSSQAIVGSWLWQAEGDLYVTTFLADGRYFDASVVADDAAHTGLEWGTYSWNAATGEITASSLGDANGDWGFDSDVDGNQFIQVVGNTANRFQPGCDDCGGTMTRVTTGSNPLIGSWAAQAGDDQYVVTFLENGTYMDASVVAGDAAHTGIEWGHYSWNAATGEISAASLGDTNGNWGFDGDVDGNQYVMVYGNVAAVFQPGCSDCGVILNRISAVPEPQTSGLMLAGLGVLGLGLLKNRRTRPQR